MLPADARLMCNQSTIPGWMMQDGEREEGVFGCAGGLTPWVASLPGPLFSVAGEREDGGAAPPLSRGLSLSMGDGEGEGDGRCRMQAIERSRGGGNGVSREKKGEYV